MNIIKILIILLVVSTGCKHEEEKHKKTVNLYCEPVGVDHNELGMLFFMQVKDSLLLFNDYFSNHILKLINLQTGKVINKFGKRGRGPYELQSLNPISVTKDGFSTYCNTKGVLNYSVKDIVSGKKTYMKKTNIQISSCTFPIQINDSIIIGQQMNSNNRYLICNLRTRKKNEFGKYPVKKNYKKNNVTALAYQGKFAVKPDKLKVVFAAAFTDNLEIFDIKGDSVCERYSHCIYPVKYTNVGISALIDKTNPDAHISITASDKYIYSLYSGKTYKKHGDNSRISDIIKVYNWQGKHLFNYKLDNQMKLITVANDDKYIIAYGENSTSRQPEILKYKLIQL